MEKTKLLMVVVVGIALMLGGCAKKAQETGFLSTYKNLEPVSDNLMRYIGPEVGQYSKFIIDPVTVKRNTSMALNQMTVNLRQQILSQLNEQHFVDTVRDNNVTATLAVKSAELVSGDPFTAVVFGQKRLTTLIGGRESKKELLVKYVIRLAPVPRTSSNGWSGLEIADYKEEVLQQ